VLIDWFTVIAQIVNFLVLVYLLKRFLYKPIIKAMDGRERRIAGRLEEADKREKEARQELEQYEQRNRELDSQREALVSQMKEDVESERKERVSKARHQVDAIRTNWYEAVEREKESFLQDLRERTGKHTYAVARRALKDLANVELEQHIVRVFIERLRNLDEAERRALKESVQKSKREVTVISAFEIFQEASQDIAQVLREYLSDPVDLRFETSPDVVCGIELRVQGRKIAWSVPDYLDGLETTFAKVLGGETKGPGKQQPRERKREALDQEAHEKREGSALGKE
jgi:F-type H+-transporting ATPase subunit b